MKFIINRNYGISKNRTDRRRMNEKGRDEVSYKVIFRDALSYSLMQNRTHINFFL